MAKQEHVSYPIKNAPMAEISSAIEQRVRQERLLDEGALHPLNANPIYAEAGPIYGYDQMIGEVGERISRTTDESQIDRTLGHYEATQVILSRDLKPDENQIVLERAIAQQTFELSRKKVEIATKRVGSQAIQNAISGYIPGFS
ncbi:MAG: hypothetical protein KBC15_03065 [Candidatus Levybacteria bacterium]|nr:hypothetical protein [Candidatus Levybacteria bacterium]